ncbi:MAG TPA: hypothetical protein DCQ47_02695, partial [Gammaproteobacteria bacterium]|nr:hypothetical protein [Gammaproteobacteria bacterium]
MSGFRPFLVLLSVVFGLLFSGCKTLDEGPDTAITLQVTSDTELSRLTLIFRNLNGDEQRVDNPLGFDIRNEAFIFSIRPGERFQDDVFIWVQGFLGDELVAQASRVSRFEPGTVIEEMFELRAAFIDNDGDGFSPCSNGPSCDCDDTQATINPLAAEVCGDVIDNNCNGAAEEDCPCVEDQICTIVPETFIDVSAGVGQCQFGIRRCNDGVLGEQCEGALGIGDEEILGNFIDDDCDGSVDEGGDCSAGASRPCFLGFVDDASHPDPTLQTGASDRALGECKLGVQECNPNGTWSSCQGEVRPQRDPETGVFKELTSQCDGLDNDCDGIIDDESYFDADGDGFTRCGTCRLEELPPGLCAESIDCNDADPLISPSAIELCGNDVDENCRCDHDDNDRPVGSDSAIAKPSLMLDGSRSCAAVNASLDCARLPRSDPNPTGVCSELAQPYFAGFVEDDAGLLGACMSCGLSFGLQCLEGGGCSDPGYDCGACNVPDEVYAARPYCTRPDPMTCRNTDEPVFLSIFDDDPYNDCGEIDCTGFYSGIVDGRCFRRADVAAETVLCEGAEQCETSQQLCPLAGAYSQPEPMPLCTFIDDGCSAEIAPTYQNQASGSDVFDECSESYQCDTAEDGFGPYYDGIATQNGLTYCFFKADVDNSSCNGEGDCQTKAQACLASTQGATVPLRPQCELPVSGCQGISNPVYGVVERFQDPYNDCASELGCCVDASGEGACCRAQGSSCSVDTECGEGLSCVEGVCCDGSCDSPCESCLAELNTANEDGTCSPLASRQTDIAPSLVC